MTGGKLYTLAEVAEILRVSRQTIYNNIRNGRIKVAKIGKEYRFTEEQLQNIIKNGYNGK